MLPIVLTEKLNMEQQLQTGVATDSNIAGTVKERLQERPMVISRNAADDTFNLEIPALTRFNRDMDVEVPYVNVNNKFEFSDMSSVAKQVDWSKLGASSAWKLPHTMFNNLQFRETNMIAMGTDNYNTRVNINSFPMRRRINFLTFKDSQKNVEANFNNLIELKTIKTISFNHTQKDWTTIDRSATAYVPTFEKRNDALYTYSHLIIKPIEPDRFKGNETVAEIYGYVDGGFDITDADYDIKDATMKSSSIGNEKVALSFEKYSGDKKPLEPGSQAMLIGELKITDPTYYDYSTGSTKVGFQAHSIIGEVIPYSFKGDYSRELDLSFNAAFKNEKLLFSKHMDDAILDPSEGEVKMHVTMDSTPRKVNFKTFTPEDIEIIRTKKLDLIGLNRLADE